MVLFNIYARLSNIFIGQKWKEQTRHMTQAGCKYSAELIKISELSSEGRLHSVKIFSSLLLLLIHHHNLYKSDREVLVY